MQKLPTLILLMFVLVYIKQNILLYKILCLKKYFIHGHLPTPHNTIKQYKITKIIYSTTNHKYNHIHNMVFHQQK